MSFIEIVQIIEELSALVTALKADGSYQAIVTAADAVKAELAKPNAQAIIEKLKAIKL